MNTLILSALIFCAFDYAPPEPMELFPYTIAASDCLVPDSVLNPSYIFLANSPSISFSGGVPYSFDKASSLLLNLTIPFSESGLSTSWKRFSVQGYCEDSFALGVGGRLFNMLGLGAKFNFYKLDAHDDRSRWQEQKFDMSLYSNIVLFDRISFAGCYENILQPDNKQQILNSNWSIGTSLVVVRGLAFTYNLTSSEFCYINTFSFSAKLLPELSLKVGYSRETTTYAFGVNIDLKHLSVSYSVSSHPYLGTTHGVHAVLRYEPLSQSSYLDFSLPPAAPIKMNRMDKININEADASDILELDYIDIELLERIVKYREIVGDVSEKALVQLGFTRTDIVNIYDQAYGFIKKSDKQPKNFQQTKKTASPKKAQFKPKRFLSLDDKNKIFAQLCGVGVTPVCALEIIDALQDAQNKKQRILDIKGLSKSLQDKVLKICAPYF